MAEIKGYNTSCRGRVRIVLADGSKTSRLYSPAGANQIAVEAESEPGYQDDFSGDPSYMCGYKSRHDLFFKAEPGRSYRLNLLETAPRQFQIEVREALSPDNVEAHLIPFQSTQVDVERHCGFFGLFPDCSASIMD